MTEYRAVFDADITFSSNFAFAYDRSQLNGSNIDFQTVAA